MNDKRLGIFLCLIVLLCWTVNLVLHQEQQDSLPNEQIPHQRRNVRQEHSYRPRLLEDEAQYLHQQQRRTTFRYGGNNRSILSLWLDTTVASLQQTWICSPMIFDCRPRSAPAPVPVPGQAPLVIATATAAPTLRPTLRPTPAHTTSIQLSVAALNALNANAHTAAAITHLPTIKPTRTLTPSPTNAASTTNPAAYALPLMSFGETPPLQAFPLQRCQGDCDANQDCATGLVCFQRIRSYQGVPGCGGGRKDASQTDYCIDPGDFPGYQFNNNNPQEIDTSTGSSTTTTQQPTTAKPTAAPAPIAITPSPTIAPIPNTPSPTIAPIPNTPNPTIAPIPNTLIPTIAPIPTTPNPTLAPIPNAINPTLAPVGWNGPASTSPLISNVALKLYWEGKHSTKNQYF